MYGRDGWGRDVITLLCGVFNSDIDDVGVVQTGAGPIMIIGNVGLLMKEEDYLKANSD